MSREPRQPAETTWGTVKLKMVRLSDHEQMDVYFHTEYGHHYPLTNKDVSYLAAEGILEDIEDARAFAILKMGYMDRFRNSADQRATVIDLERALAQLNNVACDLPGHD